MDECNDSVIDEDNYERLLDMKIVDGRNCSNTKDQYRLKMGWNEAAWMHPTCLNDDSTVNMILVV